MKVSVKQVCPGILLDEWGRYYFMCGREIAKAVNGGGWIVTRRESGEPVEMEEIR